MMARNVLDHVNLDWCEEFWCTILEQNTSSRTTWTGGRFDGSSLVSAIANRRRECKHRRRTHPILQNALPPYALFTVNQSMFRGRGILSFLKEYTHYRTSLPFGRGIIKLQTIHLAVDSVFKFSLFHSLAAPARP